MCKLHGVRLIKRIKIFESMLKKPKSSVENNTVDLNSGQTLYILNCLYILCIKTSRELTCFTLDLKFSLHVWPKTTE